METCRHQTDHQSFTSDVKESTGYQNVDINSYFPYIFKGHFTENQEPASLWLVADITVTQEYATQLPVLSTLFVSLFHALENGHLLHWVGQDENATS